LGNVDYVSDANLTISITNTNAAQAARALVLNVTSSLSLTNTRELVVPTIEKQYIVQNNTTGGQSITVKTSAGTGITVPNGRKAHLYVNGTNVIQMFDFVDINGGTIDGTPIGGSSAAAGSFTTLGASGAATFNGAVTLGDAAADNITFNGTITSHLLFTDNTYDIGASGATRPRNLFLAGNATVGGNLSVGGTLTLTGGVNLNGNVTVGDSSADTLTINATITSNLLFTDNTYDIGASGATRPRNLFLAGNATIGGNTTMTGSLTVDSTTDSSSTTTGSIQTDGGLGVAKALYVGTTVNVGGLTSGRVTYATTSGRLTDSANLTFDGTTLTVAGFSNTGNTVLGNAAGDTVTVTGTITSNLIFTDNTYDIGASGATRPRNLFLSGSGNIVGTLFKPEGSFIQWNSTGLTGGTNRGIVWADSSSNLYLGAGSGNSTVATFNSTGQSLTGALTTSGNATINGGNLTVAGTGSRGVQLLGGGSGSVDIAGDGTTYAIGVLFHNTTSYSGPMTGLYVYTSGGAYNYMSLGGSAYNNGAIYIDSNKKVGILKLPSAQFDSVNTTSMQNAQSAGIGFGAAITQGTGTLALAAGSGNQRGNLMTIYGAQGSPTTTIPYGQNYDTLGLTVALDVAAGGSYQVYAVNSYVRSDGNAIAFQANAVQTTGAVGSVSYGFYSNSTTGANLNYGFYQNGSAVYNYFNGWVGVGVANTPYGNTTFERMTVEGNVDARSWLSVRNTNSGSSALAGVIINAFGNSWGLEMGSLAHNSNALNITKDIYGTPQVMAFMATSGVMTFYGDNQNRPVAIGGGYVRLKGETGGWQIGYYTQDSAGTIKGGFGAAGSNTTQNYNFIGPEASVSFARFSANGMGVGATDPATSGTGITFPATQSASSNANTLDDYEEGTWTPVDSGGMSGFSAIDGTYVKIGRLVNVRGSFSMTSVTTNIFISGLPFAAAQTYYSVVYSGINVAIAFSRVEAGSQIQWNVNATGGGNQTVNFTAWYQV
jgi:hypothetical protein